MDVNGADIGIKLLLLHLGMLIFFCRKVLASRVHGSEGEPKLSDYWKKNGLTTLIAIAGAYSGFLILLETDELTKAAALMCGFAADSIADAAVSKSKRKFEEGV